MSLSLSLCVASLGGGGYCGSAHHPTSGSLMSLRSEELPPIPHTTLSLINESMAGGRVPRYNTHSLSQSGKDRRRKCEEEIEEAIGTDCT